MTLVQRYCAYKALLRLFSRAHEQFQKWDVPSDLQLVYSRFHDELRSIGLPRSESQVWEDLLYDLMLSSL